MFPLYMHGYRVGKFWVWKKHTFISIKKIGTHGMTLIEKSCFREVFRKKESPSPKNKTQVLLHHACTDYGPMGGVLTKIYQ